MNEGCVIVDAKNRLIDFNESARAILPRLSEARIGTDSAVVFSDRPKLLDFIRRNTDDSLEILVGEEGLEMLDVVKSLIRGRGDGVVGKTMIINDTSRQYHLALHLEELAARDSLTGLYNRRSFLDLAGHFVDQAECRNDRSISFIMLDIDHFGSASTTTMATWSEIRVLVEIARRCLSRGQILGYRVSFRRRGIRHYAPETSEEGALLLCERILDEIKDEPIIVDEAALTITASLGLAASRPPVALSTEEILRRARSSHVRGREGGPMPCPPIRG